MRFDITKTITARNAKELWPMQLGRDISYYVKEKEVNVNLHIYYGNFTHSELELTVVNL